MFPVIDQVKITKLLNKQPRDLVEPAQIPSHRLFTKLKPLLKNGSKRNLNTHSDLVEMSLGFQQKLTILKKNLTRPLSSTFTMLLT